MITLSYGYKQPQNGDTGAVWFPALNFDIQRLNDHTHDGVNSAFIDAANIARASASVLNANWVADGTGRYKQTVSCPVGYDMDNFAMTTRIAGGDLIHPTIDRVSSTSFTIYTLDNTLDYEVLFS